VVNGVDGVDISMSATGPVVEQLIQHFVQRWNFVKKNKYEEDFEISCSCI